MSHCATADCKGTATVLYIAHGSGPITYRAALSCTLHARQNRSWVARAGPTVHQTPLTPDPTQHAQAQDQLF